MAVLLFGLAFVVQTSFQAFYFSFGLGYFVFQLGLHLIEEGDFFLEGSFSVSCSLLTVFSLVVEIGDVSLQRFDARLHLLLGIFLHLYRCVQNIDFLLQGALLFLQSETALPA